MIEQLIDKYGWMRYEHPYTRSILYRHRRAVVMAAVSLAVSVGNVIGGLPGTGLANSYLFALFAVSGTLLLVAGWAVSRAGLCCAVDPELIQRCRHMRHRSRSLLRLSALFWLTTVIGAYILPALIHLWMR